MDSRTGYIRSAEALAELTPDQKELYDVFVNVENLNRRMQDELKATGRTRAFKNSPCPCGSRKRFKNCCKRTREAFSAPDGAFAAPFEGVEK